MPKFYQLLNLGASYVWMKRSVPELTSVVAGDNSGHGMVIIIRAINSPGCGCDYRCVVLDEFGADVACICPDGSRLKKDNLTACESKCKYLSNYCTAIFNGIKCFSNITIRGISNESLDDCFRWRLSVSFHRFKLVDLHFM